MTSLRRSYLSTLFSETACCWVCLSLSPLPFTSLVFSAICKASSDNHFAFLHFFFLEMVLVTVSCTTLQTSAHCPLMLLLYFVDYYCQPSKVCLKTARTIFCPSTKGLNKKQKAETDHKRTHG